MKQLLIIICIVRSIATVANPAIDKSRPLKIYTRYVLGMPFSHKADNINPMLAGQTRFGQGVEFGLSMRVYDRVHVSLMYNAIDFYYKRDSVNALAGRLYSTPDYYTTIDNNLKSYGHFTSCLGVSYVVRVNQVEIEPYFSFGVGSFGYTNDISINRKKKNDNYSEMIDIETRDEPSFFFSSNVGVNFQYKIFKWLYATGGLRAAFGTAKISFTEVTTTFLKEESEKSLGSFSQSCNNLQVQMGLQLRLWRENIPKKD